MAEVGEVYLRSAGPRHADGILTGDVAIVERIDRGWVIILVPRLGRTVAIGAWTLNSEDYWRKLS